MAFAWGHVPSKSIKLNGPIVGSISSIGTDSLLGYSNNVLSAFSISSKCTASSVTCFGCGNRFPLKMGKKTQFSRNGQTNVPVFTSISHLNIKHFPFSKPNDNIGAVRKHLFSSAGCCSITIRDFSCNGGDGNAVHQHTTFGRLMKDNQWFPECKVLSPYRVYTYVQLSHISRLSGGSAGIPSRSSHASCSETKFLSISNTMFSICWNSMHQIRFWQLSNTCDDGHEDCDRVPIAVSPRMR